MSHIARVNDSCRDHWVMSLMWMSHVHTYEGERKAHLFAKVCIESCPSCEWVMSLLWMSHVPHVSESCPFCEWVMSLMRMSHVSINESWVSHGTRMKVRTWRFCLRWYALSHVPPVNESCPSCEWVMSWSTSHGTHMKVRAWHVGLVVCLGVHWGMSLLWMKHVPHVDESCHTYEEARMARATCCLSRCAVVSRLWMSHITLTNLHIALVNASCPSCEWVISLLWVSHVPRVNESHHTHELAYRAWKQFLTFLWIGWFWLLGWQIHDRAIYTKSALWWISTSTGTDLLWIPTSFHGPKRKDKKLFVVTNISISTENWQSQPVYELYLLCEWVMSQI